MHTILNNIDGFLFSFSLATQKPTLIEFITRAMINEHIFQISVTKQFNFLPIPMYIFKKVFNRRVLFTIMLYILSLIINLKLLLFFYYNNLGRFYTICLY